MILASLPAAPPTPVSSIRFPAAGILWVVGLAVGCQPSDGSRGAATDTDQVLQAVRTAEDARDTARVALRPILSVLAHSEARVRRTAVRALGRFESPELVPAIAPLLSDSDPDVRISAVNALGQAGHVRGWQDARLALSEGLLQEREPVVRAVYAQTLGRLPYDEADAHAASEAVIMAVLTDDPGGLSATAADTRTLAIVRGLEALARTGGALRQLEPATRSSLGELAAYPGSADSRPPGPARVRRTALLAFLAAGSDPDRTVVVRALNDEDDEVRRIAARGIAQLAEPAGPLSAALVDPAPRVRWEAVRIVGALRRHFGCDALVQGASDLDPQVATLALDLLGEPCAEPAEPLSVLTAASQAEPGPAAAWQSWAHAVHSLARIAPQQAVPATSRLAAHPNGFARAWAARAAAEIPDRSILSGLAGDPVANVRTAALRGLVALDGREADPVAVAALTSDDAQLVMTAAQALEGSTLPDALPALLEALDRFTRTGRQTSRDARVAVLERIIELGSAADAEVLSPYLEDFDPRVAELVATTLSGWGLQARAAPRIPAPTPVPTPEELDRLRRTLVVLEMAGGGEIRIRLFPTVAPTNAARFAGLVAEGYFDGLTFHRIAPNFVIQGGSPGANEYWGDGPFSRDELDLVGNWRGTVGLSTRGRDTGDAQLYVNLVDNLRLDHDYTIYGEVVEGMDVVDAALEGAVIRSALLVQSGG